MQDDNVRVSAIIVEHPPVKPALGYRFDFKDRAIAFSGDMKSSVICLSGGGPKARTSAAYPAPSRR